MKTRISAIASFINDANIVIDVGSDHAYLAIELLQELKAKKVINIEKNKGPHQQGINNLIEAGLLDQTENILNDGLKDFKINGDVDFVVISGMGSSNIIDIIDNSEIEPKSWILQTNSKPNQLRKYLIDNKYEIIAEMYVCESDITYPIFSVIKNDIAVDYSQEEIFFGKRKNIINEQEYINFLNNRLHYLGQKIKVNNISVEILNEHKLLKKRLKRYDC